MGISYEEALKAQTEIEDQLLEDPNVVSVGVVAERDEFGKNTGNYVVQVGVMSVDAYQSAKKHGHSTIPPEYVIYSDKGAKEKHVRINVIREGKIEALSPSSFEVKPPSAINGIGQLKFASTFPVKNQGLMLKQFGFWPQNTSVGAVKSMSFIMRYFRK